jgi:TonB family protein
MNRAILGAIYLVLPCGWIMSQQVREEPTIVELTTPIYPPMALAARVSGEVKLDVTIGEGGTPSAVAVQSGPPMLRQAAIDSATRSKFRANIEVPGGIHPVTYRFVLDWPTKCERDNSYPRVKHEGDLVTVTEQPALICDPATSIEKVRFRSAKCLYLWKCDSKAP